MLLQIGQVKGCKKLLIRKESLIFLKLFPHTRNMQTTLKYLSKNMKMLYKLKYLILSNRVENIVTNKESAVVTSCVLQMCQNVSASRN